MKIVFLREFQLIWDWSNSRRNAQPEVTFDAVLKKHPLFPEHTNTASSKPQRLYNMGLIALDTTDFSGAEKRLLDAKLTYKAAGESNGAHFSSIDSYLETIKTERKTWERAEALFLEEIEPIEDEADSPGRYLIEEIALERLLSYINPGDDS